MRRAAVIGYPIEHSRSPLIHGHWLEDYAIAGSYTRISVPPGEAPAFLRSLGEKGLEGCNVTLPHKQAAYETADWKDESAIAVGAANTIWRDGTKICAANTDTYGFMTHLALAAPAWRKRDAPVVVLGAGGAARAIVHGFLSAGVGSVCIVNRTSDRAEEVARHFGPRVSAHGWEELPRLARELSVLVNTTALGMAGNGVVPIDLSLLRADSIVADIVYVPLETELLARARARGLVTVDGLGMLLHQAVPGFERWFGRRPEVTPALRAKIETDVRGS